MSEPAKGARLHLDGTLAKYGKYDTGVKDKMLDVAEAARIPDSELKQVLSDALTEGANKWENGHDQFFSALPADRILSLYKLGVDDHYIRNVKGDGSAKIGDVLGLILKGEGRSYKAADEFLMKTRLASHQWKSIFEGLKKSNPGYYRHATQIVYKKPGDSVKKHPWDTDGNGAIDRGEVERATSLEGEKLTDEIVRGLITFASQLVAAGNRNESEVAAQYVYEGIDVVVKGEALMLINHTSAELEWRV